ncbi:WD40 repeat-like protein [Panus rudis PR-1116 ss-1]|nr:WD40 repeat-like protein [Panus rudis PR-1116 ss-1]
MSTVPSQNEPLSAVQPPPVANSFGHSPTASSKREDMPPKPPSPAVERKSPSPAQARLARLIADLRIPRSYTVEAICAIPHPVPTHSLAASACMTHLLTGSDDGYIRDYDIYSGVNGKIFLTAPQRHHCGVMEGLMKAAQLRCWWENPVGFNGLNGPIEDVPVCPPYSLLMHSDALWCLSGSDQGNINLFTVRHEPGRLCHVMNQHRGPVSSMAMEHDEKGFYSAGWDGEAYLWDLNTGQIVRNFKSHGSQLTAVAVRPLVSPEFHGALQWNDVQAMQHANPPRREDVNYMSQPLPQSDPAKHESIEQPLVQQGDGPTAPASSSPQDDDAKSNASFDTLFGDGPDADGEAETEQDRGSQQPQQTTYPGSSSSVQPQYTMPRQQQSARVVSGTAALAPKNAPPILDPDTYSRFSPDVLMVASIDGQIVLWDKRINSPGWGVGRLWLSEKTPPWCVSACWSGDGNQIYAGRRNGTIDIYDVRQMGMPTFGTPRILKTLRNPVSSGSVSCVVAFPDGRHLACASQDNIRLWNVAEANEPDHYGKTKSGVQFKIIPGHHGGFISQMLVDRAARFLVSASSNRGWFGESTRTVFVHEIKHIQ